MKVIKVQKIPRKEASIEDILASFCYHYQQYTYQQARKLPYRRVIKMLKIARKEEARRFLELTQIAAAPHTKRGQGVSRLISKYEAILNK